MADDKDKQKHKELGATIAKQTAEHSARYKVIESESKKLQERQSKGKAEMLAAKSSGNTAKHEQAMDTLRQIESDIAKNQSQRKKLEGDINGRQQLTAEWRKLGAKLSA